MYKKFIHCLEMEIDKSKREKFIRVAESRVQNIIHSMEIMMPMGKSPNYDYTENDVEQMMIAIKETCQKLENTLKERFEIKKEKKTFSFAIENSNQNDLCIDEEISNQKENSID